MKVRWGDRVLVTPDAPKLTDEETAEVRAALAKRIDELERELMLVASAPNEYLLGRGIPRGMLTATECERVRERTERCDRHGVVFFPGERCGLCVDEAPCMACSKVECTCEDEPWHCMRCGEKTPCACEGGGYRDPDDLIDRGQEPISDHRKPIGTFGGIAFYADDGVSPAVGLEILPIETPPPEVLEQADRDFETALRAAFDEAVRIHAKRKRKPDILAVTREVARDG